MEKYKQKKQCSTTRALHCEKTIFLITRFEWISVSNKKQKYKNNNRELFGEQSTIIFVEPNVGLVTSSLSDVIATEEIIWTFSDSKIGSCMDTLSQKIRLLL